MRRLVVFAVLACLAVPAAASAGHVGWDETANIAGARVMTYHVETISVRKTTWSAQVSFKNISNATITVGSEFGLAFFADKHTEDLSKVAGFASATVFSSAIPKSLKPGASWTGTIGGSGTLKLSGKAYARVIFGPFTNMPGESHSVVWITDHYTTVGTGSATTTTPAAGPII